jgi:TolB-like protein/DNA-binding SARP family transcriptional activator
VKISEARVKVCYNALKGVEKPPATPTAVDVRSDQRKGNEGQARWSLRLLGDFNLSLLPTGENVPLPGKRERVLLAYLALSLHSRHARRKLVTLLWGDDADESAFENLRTCIFNLRKALGPNGHRIILSEGRDIVLDGASFDVDVLGFRGLAAQTGRAELEAAAKLYSGDFLAGLSIHSEEFESWRRAEATLCRDQAIDSLTRLMMQFAESGETEGAIAAGSRILRLEPFDETAVRRLMKLYAESNRRGAAIQVYQTLANTLRGELGADPEDETRLVFAVISRASKQLTDGSLVATAVTLGSSSENAAGQRDVSNGRSGSPPQPSVAVADAALLETKRGKLRWLIAGGVAALAAIVFILQFATFSDATKMRPGAGIDTAAITSSSAAVTSIAVLPFTNLSDDRQQEFFSDGITDEIALALAKVAGLRVVGRSSAFQFKGKSQDLRAIGRVLNARFVIDGSVRKQGTRIRIAAQLVEADNGITLWTENYDRELTDLFAIQEEVALAIAGALRVPLGLQEGDRLVANRGIDPQSYEQYLRVKPVIRPRGMAAIADGAAQLEQIVGRNADFAPAWGLLAVVYHLTPLQQAGRHDADELRRLVELYDAKSEAAARRAVQLDPKLADGYFALGLLQLAQRNVPEAENLYAKALSLDPTNPDILAGYSNLLLEVGRIEDGLAVRQRAAALEPFVPRFNANVANALWLNGHDEAAIGILKDFSRDAGDTSLARIYASAGRYDDAAEALSAIPPGTYPEGMLDSAVRLLRAGHRANTSRQTLPHFAVGLDFAYLLAEAPSGVLDSDEVRADGGVFVGVGRLWHPSYAPVRKTERFKTLVRKVGLVDYWRVKGWPRWCHPTNGDDFVCM